MVTFHSRSGNYRYHVLHDGDTVGAIYKRADGRWEFTWSGFSVVKAIQQEVRAEIEAAAKEKETILNLTSRLTGGRHAHS